MIKKFLIFTGALLVAPLAFAQVAPSTTGGTGHVTIGVEASAFRPDSLPGYTGGHVVGPGLYFDVNLMPRWGAEGEARWMHWHGSGGQTQSDYLIGPRYRIIRWHSLSLWGKFLMGAGLESFPENIGTGSYFAMAPGGDLNYQLNSRFVLRAGYEYQFWPSAPNVPYFPNNEMHPSGFSIGIGYRIIRPK